MPPLAQNAMLELGGVLPARLAQLFYAPDGSWADQRFLTLVSALFIHTSWLHVLGNMVYLWVFGLPLERRLGGFGMVLVFVLG